MTVTVELLKDGALVLFKYLERLQVLRLIQPKTKSIVKEETMKSRFAGRISPQTAEQLHQQLAQMREELQ